MKVLMVFINFVSRTAVEEDSEYFADLVALPKDNVFEKFQYNDTVDLSQIPAMSLRYDVECDALYWWADLAIVAAGVTTKVPFFGSEGKWDALDGEALIDSIHCLHKQEPVCYVEGA
jgi:hypothetical protein